MSPKPAEPAVTSANASPVSPTSAPRLQASFNSPYGRAAAAARRAGTQRLRRRVGPGSAESRPQRGQRPVCRRRSTRIQSATRLAATRLSPWASVAGHDSATVKGPPASVNSCPTLMMTMRMVCGRASRLPASMTAADDAAGPYRRRPPCPEAAATRTAVAAAATTVTHRGVVGIATGSSSPSRSADPKATAVAMHAATDAARAPRTVGSCAGDAVVVSRGSPVGGPVAAWRRAGPVTPARPAERGPRSSIRARRSTARPR